MIILLDSTQASGSRTGSISLSSNWVCVAWPPNIPSTRQEMWTSEMSADELCKYTVRFFILKKYILFLKFLLMPWLALLYRTGTQSVVTGTARQLEAGTGKLGVTFPSIPCTIFLKLNVSICKLIHFSTYLFGCVTVDNKTISCTDWFALYCAGNWLHQLRCRVELRQQRGLQHT